MKAVHDIQNAIRGLSSVERATIGEWLRDLLGADWRIAEPAVAYHRAAPEPHRLTVDEYLAFEESSSTKHEYVAGEIFAMAGASIRHNLIIGNFNAAFHAHLRGGSCKAFMNDVKLHLKLEHDDLFYYPDVMVACGPRELEEHFLRDPKLIIEVLSPSTERTDRGEKALNYRSMSTLEEYVLAEQNRPEVTIHRRSGDWQPLVFAGLEAVATFRSIELSLPLAQIFEGAFGAAA